jgi:hypothetical protein
MVDRPMRTRGTTEQATFSTILDQLQDELTPSRAMDHWSAALAASWQIDGSGLQNRSSVRSAVTGYLDEDEPPAPASQAPTAEAIAKELNLTDDLDADEIRRVRRDFARVNHPDLAPEMARDVATRRMQIANELIDSALKRIDTPVETRRSTAE